MVATHRIVHFARALRHHMTEAEKRLWQKLRFMQLQGCKFRRQALIGPYIVDFVCYEAGLVIEVDGGQHCENVKDVARDAWLAGEGFRVLRFWNNDVLNNTEGVVQVISEALPVPSPLVGEGQGGGMVARNSKRRIRRSITPTPALPHQGGGSLSAEEDPNS